MQERIVRKYRKGACRVCTNDCFIPVGFSGQLYAVTFLRNLWDLWDQLIPEWVGLSMHVWSLVWVMSCCYLETGWFIGEMGWRRFWNTSDWIMESIRIIQLVGFFSFICLVGLFTISLTWVLEEDFLFVWGFWGFFALFWRAGIFGMLMSEPKSPNNTIHFTVSW